MAEIDNTDRGAYIALGALFGIAAGMGIGTLLAPRRGDEVRERIRYHMHDATDKAHDRIASKRSEAREKLASVFETSKDIATDTADKVQDLADDAADKTKDAADTLKDKADE